jgi:hypothetical protein
LLSGMSSWIPPATHKQRGHKDSLRTWLNTTMMEGHGLAGCGLTPGC